MKSVFKRLSTSVVRKNDAKLTAVCLSVAAGTRAVPVNSLPPTASPARKEAGDICMRDRMAQKAPRVSHGIAGDGYRSPGCIVECTQQNMRRRLSPDDPVTDLCSWSIIWPAHPDLFWAHPVHCSRRT
jgi:hypothetical protein